MNKQAQSNETSVVTTYLAKNIPRYKMIQKLLMTPIKELVARLITAEESSNNYLFFLYEKDLLNEFSVWRDAKQAEN